jgi:hypothetical protein
MVATSPADPPGIESLTGPRRTPAKETGLGPPGDSLGDAKAIAPSGLQTLKVLLPSHRRDRPGWDA